MNQLDRREFLKTSAAGSLAIVLLRRSASARQTSGRILYVGTYTSGKSEGIYVYRTDPNTGQLTRVNSTQAVNPSFLVIDRSRRYLYAVNEVKDFGGKPQGAVSAFSIDAPGGGLTFINQQPSLGADPCHLTVDRERKVLLVANYTGGNIVVFPIRLDGSLDSATELKQHEGSGIKEQQNGPHTHCVVLDHKEKHALVTDLGIDKVMIYRLDRKRGKLTSGRQPWAQLQSGAGPRHLTLHPNGKLAYVINELDSTISVFKYDGSEGTLSHLETVSTLPSNFSGTNYCADVHLAGSGKFLYGSNRGHNSIVVFKVDVPSGRLTYVEHVSTLGDWPRNFTIDPTGRFLLVANQRSDNVVSFQINPNNGRLKPIEWVAEIPSPVCLKFL